MLMRALAVAAEAASAGEPLSDFRKYGTPGAVSFDFFEITGCEDESSGLFFFFRENSGCMTCPTFRTIQTQSWRQPRQLVAALRELALNDESTAGALPR